MNIEELRALARGVEPPLEVIEGLYGHEQIAEYNDLAFRFLERLVSARNSFVLGQAVEPELKHELRTLADVLPAKRRRAEAAQRMAGLKRVSVGLSISALGIHL